MVENKKIMGRNILYYMERKGVKASDVCRDLGFKQNTFSDWCNAKTYPRIDAIEKMANYFGIQKLYLVEDIVPIDVFTSEEKRIILELRKADDTTKEMVNRVLGIRRDIDGPVQQETTTDTTTETD